MGSNAEEAGVIKHSSAFYDMSEIAEQFDKETHVVVRSHRHKHKDSTNDERQIIQNLGSFNHARVHLTGPLNQLDNVCLVNL